MTNVIPLNRIKKSASKDIHIIGIIKDLRTTKNGHKLLEIEDETGSATAIVLKGNRELNALSNEIILDEVIGLRCQLSKDGDPNNSYKIPQWSPDAKILVAFRVEPGDNKEVHLIESSPEGGGRAKLSSRPYALPGDKFATYELNLFDIQTRKQIKPEVETLELDWQTPNLHWNKDQRHFAYEKVDRGHQRFRVIEVDSHTGQSRNLIDEKSETFIWTAHTENLRLSRVNYLKKTDEIIYVSEMDGWRHIYLVDIKQGKITFNNSYYYCHLGNKIKNVDMEDNEVFLTSEILEKNGVRTVCN